MTFGEFLKQYSKYYTPTESTRMMESLKVFVSFEGNTSSDTTQDRLYEEVDRIVSSKAQFYAQHHEVVLSTPVEVMRYVIAHHMDEEMGKEVESKFQAKLAENYTKTVGKNVGRLLTKEEAGHIRPLKIRSAYGHACRQCGFYNGRLKACIVSGVIEAYDSCDFWANGKRLDTRFISEEEIEKRGKPRLTKQEAGYVCEIENIVGPPGEESILCDTCTHFSKERKSCYPTMGKLHKHACCNRYLDDPKNVSEPQGKGPVSGAEGQAILGIDITQNDYRPCMNE